MPTPLPLIFTPSSDSEEEENLPPLVAAAAAPVRSTSVTQSQSSSQGSVAGSPQQQWRATKRDALRSRPLPPPDFTTWEQWLDYRLEELSISKGAQHGSSTHHRLRANLLREIQEVKHRGEHCQTCILVCTPATKHHFNWAHKAGQERAGNNKRMISRLIENNSVIELEREFPCVWLQCTRCHKSYPNWDGKSIKPPLSSLSASASSASASAASASAASASASASLAVRPFKPAGLSRTAIATLPRLHAVQSHPFK
jgi:hypothetical protein